MAVSYVPDRGFCMERYFARYLAAETEEKRRPFQATAEGGTHPATDQRAPPQINQIGLERLTDTETETAGKDQQ